MSKFQELFEKTMEQDELNLNPITRQEIKKLFDGSHAKRLNVRQETQRKKSISIGMGKISLEGNTLSLSYGGNQGTGFKQVDEKLKNIGFPSIQDLKNNFDVVEETGKPDYAWSLKLKI
ncbi:hypothetical protein KY334_06275 [Candidatus Woesearchaeota archaeon]|nr:hypothetical protein [Candidatus Woesearchaeota archaeon]